MNGRYQNIDIAKGITICLMVVGHSSLPLWLSNWIWSFHMPFFFFVSGLLTSWNKEGKGFFMRKTKTLLLPFVMYSVINLLLYPLYGNDLWTNFVVNTLLHGWGGYALWFIPVLYFSLLLCKMIKSISLNINLLYIGVFLLMGGGMSLYHIGLPWTLSTVPIACVYILMARLVKVQIMDFLRSLNLIQNLIVVILGLAITFLISNNYRLDLAYNHILPIIPLLIGAVAGTIMILCCSNIILRVRYFPRIWIVIGQNTMIVLAFSQCIIKIINNYFVINPVLKYLILAIILSLIMELKNLLKHRVTLCEYL